MLVISREVIVIKNAFERYENAKKDKIGRITLDSNQRKFLEQQQDYIPCFYEWLKSREHQVLRNRIQEIPCDVVDVFDQWYLKWRNGQQQIKEA